MNGLFSQWTPHCLIDPFNSTRQARNWLLRSERTLGKCLLDLQIFSLNLSRKFHSLEQVKELGRRFIGPKFEIIDHDGPLKDEIRASSFAVVGKKSIELPRETIESALKFEFNLPLPEGRRFGRTQDICNAIQSAKTGPITV